MGSRLAELEAEWNGDRRVEGRSSVLRGFVEDALGRTGSAFIESLLDLPRREAIADRPRPRPQTPAAGAVRESTSGWNGGATPARRIQDVSRDPEVLADASRAVYVGASALSFSVLADSGVEHYRGGFYNRAMYIAPTVSLLTLIAGCASAARPGRRSGARRLVFGAAIVTGLIGSWFHLYNVGKREGGWSWLNVFYGAPLAAPLGITFAGLLGLAAGSFSGPRPDDGPPRLLGRPAGPVLGLLSAAGLLGTAAEAGLLHFRGAFQDPFMYVPVVLPPVAALALAVAVLSPPGAGQGAARALLRATAAAGVAGMGFHAWGIHRNMGGWYNWSQMIQQGPPLPAPPAFSGMALAGLAALELTKGEAHA